MLKRALVTFTLGPLALAAIWFGGIYYLLMVIFLLGVAAWEYDRLFHAGGLQPATILVVGGTLLIIGLRAWHGFAGSDWLVSLLVLASLTYHLVAFERGRQQAGSDFGVTLGGILYIGWIGAYMISLRMLPEGQWWTLVALPAVWLADTGAYLIGSRIGRHKMTPHLSPKKSWEGYLGGILWSTAGSALLALAYQTWLGAPAAVTPLRAAGLAFLLSVLTILGDLGESMIKRQVGIKDSGTIFPGHGGAFDRIDSWLWAGVIAYYLVIWFTP